MDWRVLRWRRHGVNFYWQMLINHSRDQKSYPSGKFGRRECCNYYMGWKSFNSRNINYKSDVDWKIKSPEWSAVFAIRVVRIDRNSRLVIWVEWRDVIHLIYSRPVLAANCLSRDLDPLARRSRRIGAMIFGGGWTGKPAAKTGCNREMSSETATYRLADGYIERVLYRPFLPQPKTQNLQNNRRRHWPGNWTSVHFSFDTVLKNCK